MTGIRQRYPIARNAAGDARTPVLAAVLGYGPVALLPLLAIASTALPPLWAFWALLAGQLWAAAVLIFMGGVRRGLSFHTADGPRTGQIVTALVYFGFGLAALVVPIGPALIVLMVGYALAGLLDRRAARVGDTPRFFAHLRLAQAAIAIAGLGGLLARLLAI